MNINEMINALDTAYSMAYKEMLSKKSNEDIVETLHKVCDVDCDDIVQRDNYLLLTPKTLEALFAVIRTIIIGEIISQNIGPRILKRLANIFNLTVEITIK